MKHFNHIQSISDIIQSYHRIKSYIHKTPILYSRSLNQMLGHKIYFKAESLQKTGAFKVRGILNHLLTLKDKHLLPQNIVTYSTGNHGIGLAWVAKLFNLHARIYLPKNTSVIKQLAANHYGAEVILTNSRIEAEQQAKNDQEKGFYYLHPSDSESSIAGAGTICYEAINQLGFSPDAIFASCGGGGLLSGTYLAKTLVSPSSSLIGSEPLQANDAFISLNQNYIFSFADSPNTIADGLRALSISERTFKYIKKLDDMVLVPENSIYYWTLWITHLLKVVCEPSCALNMAAACNWLSRQSNTKKILVIISGGNTIPQFFTNIIQDKSFLKKPNINDGTKSTISLKYNS